MCVSWEFIFFGSDEPQTRYGRDIPKKTKLRSAIATRFNLLNVISLRSVERFSTPLGDHGALQCGGRFLEFFFAA